MQKSKKFVPVAKSVKTASMPKPIVPEFVPASAHVAPEAERLAFPADRLELLTGHIASINELRGQIADVCMARTALENKEVILVNNCKATGDELRKYLEAVAKELGLPTDGSWTYNIESSSFVKASLVKS